jgi:hypothetical protein
LRSRDIIGQSYPASLREYLVNSWDVFFPHQEIQISEIETARTGINGSRQGRVLKYNKGDVRFRQPDRQAI